MSDGVEVGRPSWWAAENIRLWRRKAGYPSAGALAERITELGVPMNRAVLSNIENHRREALTIEELCAFAKALNVPLGELTGLEWDRLETCQRCGGTGLDPGHG